MKLIVVRIDDQHVFVHDMSNEACPAEVIERCTTYYRRRGFTDNLLRFDVVELEPVPAGVEPVP